MEENPLLKLHRILSTRFNEAELRTLCDLHIQEVKYDELPGEGLANKARELITYFDRRKRVQDLIDVIRKSRPDIASEDLPTTETGAARAVRRVAISAGVVLIVILILLLLASRCPPPKDVPQVSLVSLNYTVDDWDTRSVDLRTASDSGIEVELNRALRFSDLWVSIPADALDYRVYAEFYAGNDYTDPIGASGAVPLKQGVAQLEDVQVSSNLQWENHSDTWRVQKDWESIAIILITQRGNDVVGRNRYSVKFNPRGQAWFQTPPNVNFASIVYAINDGPDQVLDFRADNTRGIEAAHPFTLTLREVWYNSNDQRENSNMKFYAYLGQGEYNEATMHYTDPIQIQADLRQVSPFKPMSWPIPPDFVNNKYKLVVYWIRNDGAAMNVIEIPIRFSLKALQTFDFTYADLPTNHGWQILDPLTPITFTHQTDGYQGEHLLMTSASALNSDDAKNGMEIPVSADAAAGTSLDILAKDGEGAAFYARVQMKSQSGTSLKTAWLKFTVGPGQIQKVADSEWLIEVTPKMQDGDWRLMSIDLADAVNRTYGQQGWRYQRLNSIRLRGDMALASIVVSQ